jgi:CubicO group peptidase (beta-lactamase class C family)
MVFPLSLSKARVASSRASLAAGEAVAAEVHHLVQEGLVQHGIQVAAYHRGTPLVSLWGGACPSTGTPVREDSLFMGYSIAKGLASTAMCMGIDRVPGLAFDEPVARVWPGFGQKGKGAVTIADAAGYRAGMPEHPTLLSQVMAFRRGGWRGHWDEGIEFVEQYEPEWTPGTRAGYHPMSYSWIVGGIVEAVDAIDEQQRGDESEDGESGRSGGGSSGSSSSSSCGRGGSSSSSSRSRTTGSRIGRHLSDIVSDDIARPLGFEHEMFMGRLPSSDRGRVVRQIPLVPPSVEGRKERFNAACDSRIMTTLANSSMWSQMCLPSSNGFFTARSVAAVYGAWANEGSVTSDGGPERVRTQEHCRDRVQLVSRSMTLEVAARIADDTRLAPATTSRFATKGTSGYRDSLGFHPYAHEEVELYGDNSPHTIGCSGAGGNIAFADPVSGLSLVVLKSDYTETRLGMTVAERIAAVLREHI